MANIGFLQRFLNVKVRRFVPNGGRRCDPGPPRESQLPVGDRMLMPSLASESRTTGSVGIRKRDGTVVGQALRLPRWICT